MSPSDVVFVICARNNRDILDGCLNAVAAQTAAGAECIVVDDGSTDGTADHVRGRFPWVRLLINSKNAGPSISRNLAVRATKAKGLAFLDSDVELDPRWLDVTLAALNGRADVGIVGGKLIVAAKRRRLDSYGGELGRLGLGWNAREGQSPESVTHESEPFWIASAAMLMRRDLFDRLGGFDETFFYGYEDSDLGWRARLMGFRSLCLPDAIGYHHVSYTVLRMGDAILFHYCKNRLRSILKNYGWPRLVIYLPLYALYAAADIVLRPQRAPKIKAWWWNVAALRSTMAARSQVQRSRVATDAGISPMFSRRLLPAATLGRRRAAMKESEE